MKAFILKSEAVDRIPVDDLKQYGFSVQEIHTLEKLNHYKILDTDCIFAPAFFEDICVLPLLRNLGEAFPHVTIFVYHTKEESSRVRHCLQGESRFILYDLSLQQKLPSVIAEVQTMKELRSLVVSKGICRAPASYTIKNACEYILRNFKEAEHHDVYRSLNPTMSEAVFNRRFKEECGITVDKFIHSLRMEYAAYLARKTNWPLKEIASSCGYRNHNRFSKMFKAYHREPFRAYRKFYGNQLS
jgi:AraC-like DNA-binding protein